MIGDYIANGVIMVTTNTQDFGGYNMSDASLFLEYKTITPSYNITYPIYDSDEKRIDRNPDFRNLLYWNPQVNLTNKEAAVTLREAIEELERMFDDYFDQADESPNGGHPRDCEKDDCCLIDFFYYYDPILVNVPCNC